MKPASLRDVVVLEPDGLEALVAALLAQGRRVIGPVVRDGAIMLDDVDSAAELPWGTRDDQDAGRYALTPGAATAAFGAVHGPQSWKRVLFPPRELVWRARRAGDGFEVDPGDNPDERPLALLGVRPCDLAAIGVLDRVLGGGAHPDGAYLARRSGALVIAVQCTHPGGTCFCASMGTGPRAGAGADLTLTELDGAEHAGVILAEAASERGAAVLAAVPHRPATGLELGAAETALADAESSMGRMLDNDDLPSTLRDALGSARWEAIGERCLSCANCTLVCPTCFCSTVEDLTDVTGDHTERWARWDSCFSADFSYIHGGSVRTTTASRYRQWLTHKLGTWHDQFGTSGCVGCGRCITWCPVGIDITEETLILHGEVVGREVGR